MSEIFRLFKMAKNPKKVIQDLKQEKAEYDARKQAELEKSIPYQETQTLW